MSTLLIHHPQFLQHLTPVGHPERPDRIRAIDRILEHERFQPLERELAPTGDAEQILLAHPISHLDLIRHAAPDQGMVRLDEDTSLSPGTWEAALRGVGAACLAVDEVVARKVDNAFCAIRPPGHHAEAAKAMGFCFFNNVAIAARWAQKKHGLERVAIMDFDVHHGNGTQDIFWDDATVMYTSTHQMPLYPGTGATGETGTRNTVVNAPLRAGDGADEFKDAMETVILPRIENFAPDLVIISAGFDAHHRDPLGGLKLTEADFAWATGRLMDIAERRAGGRLVSVLEGGYDLEGLARSTAAHVMTLMGS